MFVGLVYFIFFFFNDTATTEIYTLSLHDALPILKSGAWERQSSAPSCAARATLKAPVRRPDCIGLYTMTPVPCAAHHGSSAAATSRRIAENGGCTVSTGPSRSGASSCRAS